MATKYPKDRFDSVPTGLQRVGAHRAPRKRGRGWIAFGWAVLATVILVGIGVLVLVFADKNLNIKDGLDFGGSPTTSSPTSTPTPTPTIVPTVDPNLSVTVLNGTTEEGLATTVSDVLSSAGWKVGTPTNADETDLTKTVVYYSDAKNEAAALGIVRSIPNATVMLSQTFADTGTDLMVVVGSDYQAPAN